MNKAKIKILVGYHKPAILIRDEIYTPIHLGRALANEASKDGLMSQKDYEWMCENMIGDDTGENISILNRYLNELTGIYWAYKNYDKLDDPDYIGYVHYRRHFIFDEKAQLAPRIYENFFPTYEFINEDYKKLIDINKLKNFENYDLIASEIYDMKKNKSFKNLYESFSSNTKDTSSLKLLEYLFKKDEKFKDYKDIASGFLKDSKYYYCNMFVMKKELFFEFCEFLFEALFWLYDKRKDYLSSLEISHFEKREIGYCAEYLSTFFLLKQLCKGKKIKELPISFIKNTDPIKELLPRENEISLVFAFNENHWVYFTVSLKSLIKNANFAYNYKIYILYNHLSLDIQKRLEKWLQDEGVLNFSFCFYDMSPIIYEASKQDKNLVQELHVSDFAKLLIPKIFKNFGKIIYLNSCLIFKRDIAMLYDFKLDNKMIAAVKDSSVLFCINWPWNYHKIRQKLNIKEILPFFNDAVLIYNIKEMQKYDLILKFLKYFTDKQKRDLRILNSILFDKISLFSFIFFKIFEKKVKYLSLQHNVLISVDSYPDKVFAPINLVNEYNQCFNEACILNFNAKEKPWDNPYLAHSFEWWSYARKIPFYEDILWTNLKHVALYGADLRLKNHLSFKIGQAILETKTPIKIFILPFKLFVLTLQAKKDRKIYSSLARINPSLKLPPLNHYADYKESLKIKQYLSYQLGSAFLKNPLTFLFKIKKIYENFKKQNKEN